MGVLVDTSLPNLQTVSQASDMRAPASPCRVRLVTELYLRAYWRYYVAVALWVCLSMAISTVIVRPA